MATSTITGREVSDNPIRRFFGGIGDLAKQGRDRRAADRANPTAPLGDSLPEAPDLGTSPTGVSTSGTREALEAERLELRGIRNKTPEQLERAREVNGRLNEVGDPEATVEELGQGAVSAQEDAEQGEFAAQLEDQEKADDLAGDIATQRDETTEEIDKTRGELEEDKARIEGDIQIAKDNLEGLPQKISSEFESLRAEFDTKLDASFERVEGQREEALGQVMQGRSEAMEAAVQGTQGAINTQVAQIQSDPNLSAGQKRSMIAQVKLAGASSLGATVGQSVLGFNQLAAQTAVSFGQITGQLEATGLTTAGQLIGAQGNAFAQAQVAVGEMTNQLLQIDANSSIAFASSQTQLLATRAQAQMGSNDLLLRTLPEQSTPYLDLTGSSMAAYAIGSDIMKSQFIMDLQSFGAAIQVAMLQSMEGSPLQNLFEGAMAGFQAGGATGAIFGAAGAFVANQDPGPRV